MIYTTLNKIRDHRPCESGWKTLLTNLGKTRADDEPLALTTVLDSNGLDDALWCLRTLPEYNNKWRLMAVRFAREVQHLMDDQRSLDALDVAERYANGYASDDELAAARDAARDAARTAARTAARDAARDAALASAWASAWASARASARASAWASAGAAARAVAWRRNAEIFTAIVSGEEV